MPPEPGPSASSPAPDNEKAVSEPGTQPESKNSTGQPESSTVQPESEATSANSEPPQDGSQILINIDKSRQEMTVFVDGIEQYTWPVSTGKRGYSTASGTDTRMSIH